MIGNCDQAGFLSIFFSNVSKLTRRSNMLVYFQVGLGNYYRTKSFVKYDRE